MVEAMTLSEPTWGRAEVLCLTDFEIKFFEKRILENGFGLSLMFSRSRYGGKGGLIPLFLKQTTAQAPPAAKPRKIFADEIHSVRRAGAPARCLDPL